METQLNFEIIFRAPLGEMYTDITYLSFIRTPLLKNCSYAIMRINLTPVLIQQMINDLNNNIFADYQIEIYSIDDASNIKPVTVIFNKLFKVLYVKPLEPLKFDKALYPCYLVLSNPFFHYMSTTNAYNCILENKTAYNSIQSFEDFIKNTYGDIFKIRHIGTKTNVNKYKYDQLLIKAKNDLNVPTYLINTFKPFNSFNFYFFDDFHIDNESDNEITCHYINVVGKDNLNQFDITSYADIAATSTKLDIYPMSDQFLNLDKVDQTITILNRDSKYNTKKSIKSNIPKHTSSGKINDVEIVKDRVIKVGEYVNPIQKKSFNNSSQHVNIYSPDDSNNAMDRFNKFKDFFLNKLDSIQFYETTSCLPDWCQFGRSYNLDSEDPTSYIYTPISIVNMFVRNNIKEHYCTHIVRYSMLKFINETVKSSFWNSDSF